jgi:hypothetical protein
MKSSRVLVIVLGVIAALVVIVGALALSPPVQRWAVLRATSSVPGLKLEVDRVSAGFSQLALSGVTVEQSGVEIKIDRLDADYSLRQLLFSDRLVITRLVGRGVAVDASRMTFDEQAAAVSSPATAPGFLAEITLPLEMVIDELDIEGRGLIPLAANTAPVAVTFKLTGGGFAPGKEGTLRLSGTLNNPVPDAVVSTLGAEITLRAVQTEQRGFDRVAMSAVLDAEGSGITGQTQLNIAAELSRDLNGENYVVNIDTLLGGKPENVLALQARLPAQQNEFDGEWTLRARKEQFAPFLLGLTVPEFDVEGEGNFGFSPVTLAVRMAGRLDANINQLELLDPKWAVFGPLKTNIRFDVAEKDQVVKLNHLKVSLHGENPVLDLEAVNAAEFNLATSQLQVGEGKTSDVLDFKLHRLPLAWVQPFVDAVTLTGEDISGRFSVISEQGNLRLRSIEPLAVRGLTATQHDLVLVSQATISAELETLLTENDVQVLVRDFSLRTPAGDSLSATGSINAPVSLTTPFVIAVNYQADLPTLLAPWVPLGHVKSSGEVDVTVRDQEIELRRFAGAVTDGAGAPFFTASGLRPFTWDSAQGKIVGAELGSVDLLKVSLGTIPLSKIPLGDGAIQLGGALSAGDFLFTTEGAGINMRAVSPVKVDGLSVRNAGELVLTGLTILAQPTIEISDGSTGVVRSGDIVITNASGAMLLSLTGEASMSESEGIRASATFMADIPALGSQPLFAGAQSIAQGKASGEVRAALTDLKQVEARLTVNSLVARDSQEVLPVANLSMRAVVQPDGKITLQAPLLLDRAGNRSDLNFMLDLTPEAENYRVAGKLNGDHVELEDLMAVAAVFQTAPKANAASTPNRPTAPGGPSAIDTSAFWSKFPGEVLLDVKSVTHGSEWAMTGLTGVVVSEPNRLSWQKVETVFDAKSSLTAKGALNFVGGATPYQLTSEFSLLEFDVGKLFKALESTQAPTLEGIFTVQGKAQGAGRTLEDLFTQTQGEFQLTSRQGVFRGLKRVSEKVSIATRAVEALGSLLGGSSKLGKAAEKVAGNVVVVDQIAQFLGEIPFDQMSLSISRDASLAVKLQNFSLMALDIRLAGAGQLSHVENKPFLQQPLNATLSLAARGRVEEALNKLGVLESTRDEFGYAKSKEPLVLGGSALRPDPTPFFTKLLSMKLNEALTKESEKEN